MNMTERHSYKELWVIAGILLAVILVARLPKAAWSPRDDAGARMVAMMGSSRRIVSPTEPFRGADMTAVMGDCRLDLRKAAIQPGEEVVIDLLAVMGGVYIRVPDNWIVDTSAIPVF